MNAFARLRQWANRDNGRIHRAGNRRLGAVEAVGYLLFIAALVMWQLHDKLDIRSFWSYSLAAIGLVIAVIGESRSRQ